MFYFKIGAGTRGRVWGLNLFSSYRMIAEKSPAILVRSLRHAEHDGQKSHQLILYNGKSER